MQLPSGFPSTGVLYFERIEIRFATLQEYHQMLATLPLIPTGAQA